MHALLRGKPIHGISSNQSKFLTQAASSEAVLIKNLI
nr:MAG TPA: hypothetical protein [Caudoviricetes sp.]